MPRNPNQLYLVFSPKSIPFAELIFFSKHLKDTQSLKLGIHRNLLLNQVQLIVPKGKHSDTRKTLIGKSSILRFFSRLAETVSDPFQDYEKNVIFQELRLAMNGGAFDSKLRTFLLAKKSYISSEKFSIADCLAYEWLSSSQLPADSFWGQFEKEHVAWARGEIKTTLATIPILNKYKFAIIEQVVTNTKKNVEEILDTLALLKSDIGYGVNIHKLKLGTIPEVTEKLLPKFKTNEMIRSISVQGAFINFVFKQDALHHQVATQSLRMGSNYGSNSSGFGMFAICEYSSPNIAKPFHAGHLRSTIIGSFIQKLLIANGWETMSVNYLGDWGKQYGLLAVGFEKYGSEIELEKVPIKHLYDVYVRINKDAAEDDSIHDLARAYFKKMEDGDGDALMVWKRFRDMSIVAYKEIYKRINVSFDLYSGESQYSLKQMKGVIDELQQKGLLTPLDGALVVDLEHHGLGTAVIGKTDGSMLYLSRDIAAAEHRYSLYGFDKMYYMVGGAQTHHFNQLFKILELEGKTWASKCQHIGFGLIKSKDGNMSTRKGTVVFLQQILDHVQEEMHEVMKRNEAKYAQIENPERVSDIVGISAIMIQDMGARRIKDYAFDWARMLSFEGDTGPYLQYAHARLCSIQRTSQLKVDLNSISQYLPLLVEEKAHAVLSLVSQYPDLISRLTDDLEPCQLVMFSFRLAHAVSVAYQDLWVHGQPEDLAIARLVMYGAARVTLGNALTMLGLEPLERM